MLPKRRIHNLIDALSNPPNRPCAAFLYRFTGWSPDSMHRRRHLPSFDKPRQGTIMCTEQMPARHTPSNPMMRIVVGLRARLMSASRPLAAQAEQDL
jgi:hypothetical protein